MLMVLFFIGWKLTGLIPPPSPELSPEQIAARLTVHATQTRLGCLVMMFAIALYGIWSSVICLGVYRTESRRFPLFTFCSLVLCGGNVLAFEGMALCWAMGSFRAGMVSPEVTQAFNDLAFFVLT